LQRDKEITHKKSRSLPFFGLFELNLSSLNFEIKSICFGLLEKIFSLEIIFGKWYKNATSGVGFSIREVIQFGLSLFRNIFKKLEKYFRTLDLLEKGIGIGL
jgi:hypothetical protein